MIQLLRLRKFFSEEKQKEIVFDKLFSPSITAPSVRDLFSNIDKYVEKIPQKERYNCYYTAALCGEGKRQFLRQDIIPFDIDGLGEAADLPGDELLGSYVSVIAKALGIEPHAINVIFSGHGLQLIIETTAGFDSVKYFDEEREHYKALCEKINRALKPLGMPGNADPTVFSGARILRLPNTWNQKPNKPNRLAKVLQLGSGPIDFDIRKRSGLPAIRKEDHIDVKAFARFPRPDSPAVMNGCAFLQHCKSSPEEISEPTWYAMLSITGRLENGAQLSHDLSQGHPGYSHSETEEKLRHATQVYGPRTCQNISALFDGCRTCPHNGKIASPILIRSPEFIRTSDTGFHDIAIDKNGNPRPGKPNYEDLRRFFEGRTSYRLMGGSKIVYVWNGRFYDEWDDAMLENFAQTHFLPTANTQMTQEFKNLVQRTNIVPATWFQTSTDRKINFANGVLNMDTMELLPHSKEIGFRYALPYDHDPGAKAPLFEKFLEDVTQGDSAVQSVLLEFAGYCLSNDTCWPAKALVMTGEGANGKSTFMNLLRECAGEKNYTSLTLSDLKADGNRQLLDGKLFNLAEETPTKSLTDSSLFKNLVSGGETIVRMIYKRPYHMRNKAKLMFSCNDLPAANDATKGFFRRLLIVPFKAEFTAENGRRDPFLDEKLRTELPGVFNLFIAGYRRLKVQRDFTKSTVLIDELDAYRLDVDNVAQWFEEQVAVLPLGAPNEVYVPVDRLYTAYKFFSEARGTDPLSYNPFAKRLARLVPEYKDRQSKSRVSGRHLRQIRGIQLADASQF